MIICLKICYSQIPWFIFFPLEQQKNTLRYPPCSDKPKSIIHMVNSPFWLLKSYWIILNPNLSPIWTNSHIPIDIIDLNVTDYTSFQWGHHHWPKYHPPKGMNEHLDISKSFYPTKLQIGKRITHPLPTENCHPHLFAHPDLRCLEVRVVLLQLIRQALHPASPRRCSLLVAKKVGKPWENHGKRVRNSRHISWKWRKHPGKLMEMTDDVGFCCTLYIL